MEFPQPQQEHQWLQRLVGEWTYESECSMGPDQPSMKNTGREVVRSLGGLWTVGEWFMDDLKLETCDCILTLGYDPAREKYVGTFVSLMMTNLWTYEGTRDGDVLTLDTEGPSMAGDGQLTRYQDIYTFVDNDHRTLTSQFRDDDGNWQAFMSSRYDRTK